MCIRDSNNTIEIQLAGRQKNIKFIKLAPMLYTILLNYDTFAYTAVVRLPATAAFLVAYLNWQYILPRKDRPLCDMICVLLQVTAGCWQPCHA